MLMTLISALQVIIRKNPVHAVLWLILAFFNSSAIMILLHAEYIAMITLIVYVGAVVILFLFVVMLLDVDITAAKNKLATMFPTVFIAAAVFIAITYYALQNSTTINNLSFKSISENIDPTYNIALNLYTHYLVEFQISALILFLAMIGTISLVLDKKRSSTRQQSITKQLLRNQKNSIMMVEVKSNKGVKI